MDITEVRIKLADGNDERLQAFCSITFDDSFVVRDIKIIDGPAGLFVAMPARQNTTGCPHCRSKNSTRALFCSQCGRTLVQNESREPNEKLYADIAHPINAECREMIQSRIIEEFLAEKTRMGSLDSGVPQQQSTADRHHPLKRPHVVAHGLGSGVDAHRSVNR